MPAEGSVVVLVVLVVVARLDLGERQARLGRPAALLLEVDGVGQRGEEGVLPALDQLADRLALLDRAAEVAADRTQQRVLQGAGRAGRQVVEGVAGRDRVHHPAGVAEHGRNTRVRVEARTRGTDVRRHAVGEFVRLEVEGAVGTIRLDRPKMNALNGQVTAELREAAVEAGSRSDVRAVVLYGGERVFAAGADIKEMSGLTYADMVTWGTGLQEALKVVAKLPKPVVAAVTGYALGGGFELALTADFRVLGERAKVGVPEIQLGVIPGAGGTQRLTRLVGPAKAKGMVFTGRHVGAEEALALGIADLVVPDADVYTAAVEMASQYAEGPAVALRAAKQAIDEGLELDLDSALRLETSLFAGLFATEDQKAGMQSFLEQGPGKATFTGR